MDISDTSSQLNPKTNPILFATVFSGYNLSMAAVAKRFNAFKIYLIWNAFRFLTVGVLDYRANHLNRNETQGMSNDCCRCYYVSQDPITYGIDPGKRFDLSYCMPSCTDCNHCESLRNQGLVTVLLL